MKKILLIFILCTSLTFGSSAFAQLKKGDIETNSKKITEAAGYEGVTGMSLPVTISLVIKIFLGTLGIILLVIIIAAGFSWFTAGGDTAKVKKAKDNMTNAIIGLLIVLSAYSITYFVFKSADSLNSVNGGGSGVGANTTNYTP